ncbi:peptidase S28 [Gloeophyllum trabeum ATCC 11539]|uniref:Peptidase S28 n=1 Tax=Gloeophyllum trabeum (strain ATCC 11539 / FP-39264 / Madison 617) TaxID=670483 RepID=S7RES1_GLOTA|nr:peptidase S28 [Gloeophyllum trabeum ATCC 11539]EPQ50969.1 peptidase S28 [Gloeophyllum trabeum ATCC 11539]
MWAHLLGLTLLASHISTSHGLSSNPIHLMGRQGVNLRRLDQINAARARAHSSGLVVQDALFTPTQQPEAEFTAYTFEQPLDHFSNATADTFGQRYWVNTRHYKPGTNAPVIVLDGGETSGEDRLPFLDTGIVEILAKATGGVGVVLEHRYYGGSIPVKNFSTDSLRFLDNDQSAADSANFMRNVNFDGIDENLTAPNTPWIYYGGSYAGARAAHMKILYPDLVYGAIASSGVTHAQIMYWEYMDIIRRAADPKCSARIQTTVKTVDALLAVPRLKRTLKGLFGLADLEHDEDFASVLETPLGYWQAKVWDPAVGSTKFDEFCEALEHGGAQSVTLPGGLSLDFALLNYAKWIRENVVSQCPEDMTVEDCFGTFDDAKFQDTSLDQTWRAWQFQVCTQWGYFITAPPDRSQPSILSKHITLEYLSMICRQAFPKGEHFKVPAMPNVTAVNSLGDFAIAADRLAIIDGEVDPWRPATPHSEYAPDRSDTVLQPFKLIPDAVHHYDEYGLRDITQEPPEIMKVHLEMIDFVTEWLKDWKKSSS